MLRQKIIIAALSLFMALAVMAQTPWAQELILPENPMSGRLIFYQKGCMKCHSVRGEGGKIGPELSERSGYRSVTQMAGVMWNHFPRMYRKMQLLDIPFPRFTSNEMAELIAYIYFSGYFDQPATPADKLKGKALFRQKGCADCHSIGDAKKESIGPDLTKWKKFISPVLWTQLMWNHSPAMSRKMKEKGVSRPQFEGNEMRDLIAYIRESGGRSTEGPIYALPGNPAEGRRLFNEKNCILCHSIFGVGGKIGPSLTARRYSRTVTQLAGIMWNHSPMMVEKMNELGVQRPQFSGGEMADVIAFLFFLGYFDRPGDPVKGEALFISDRCIRCHTVRGEGGEEGPNLTKYSRLKEPMQPVLIAQAMWNHAPLMFQALKEKSIEWPRFSGRDMNDLMAYIRGAAEADQ